MCNKVSKGKKVNTAVVLYKSLVRSVMDYAIFLYYPSKKKVRYKGEQAQFAGIRTALEYRNSTPTNVIIGKSKVMLMKHRTEYLAISFLSEKLVIEREETERVMDRMSRRERRELLRNPNKEDSILYKAWKKLKIHTKDLWTGEYEVYNKPTTTHGIWKSAKKKM